jgi:hypothetical protein
LPEDKGAGSDSRVSSSNCRAALGCSQARAAAGLVNAARWEKPASGPGRLVLTLNAAAEVREQYVLRPSVDTRWRLVIELAPASGSRTAVAALPRVKPRIDGAAPGAGKRPHR